MKSLQAHLLVAAPELLDPNFVRTVVLLVEHSDQGAFGLVLNRLTTMPLEQAWQQVKDSPCAAEAVLRLGGPCEGPLMVLHNRPQWHDKEVLPGLFFSVSPENIEPLVTENNGPALFFAGYAGWGPGQLESELEAGGWLTAPTTAEEVLSGDETLWERTVRRLNDARLVDQLGIKHVPVDPRVN
jgi:putative transcriptional regulator